MGKEGRDRPSITMSKTASQKKIMSRLMGGADSHGREEEGNIAVKNEAIAKVESFKNGK